MMVHLCLLLFLFLCVIEFLFFAYFGYSAFLSETKIMACSKFLPTEKKKNCKNEMKNVKCFSLSSFPILNFILLETQMIFIARLTVYSTEGGPYSLLYIVKFFFCHSRSYPSEKFHFMKKICFKFHASH